MRRLLAIGNSFSDDATYFLHGVCRSAGEDTEIINLFIGGCSLERHWQNVEQDRRDYELRLNEVNTGRLVSICDALETGPFDAVVLHQASGDSGWENTYEPFLSLLLGSLEKHAPGAKVYLNETWAYEQNSTHPHFMRYNRDQAEMLCRLKAAYEQAAKAHGLPLIRSGELIQTLRTLPYFDGTVRTITRDGFHLDYVYGRYAVALLWAREIFGVEPPASFVPAAAFTPHKPPDSTVLAAIRKAVDRTPRA